MLSDTCFDCSLQVLDDVARYSIHDDVYGYLPEDLDETVRRLVPIWDMHRAMDAGCEPQPIDKETEDRLMWEMLEVIIDRAHMIE